MNPLDLVHATPYEQHRDYVLAVLRRRCGWLGSDEREATFHDAYAVLLEKQRDGHLDPDRMHPRQLRAYLTQTAIHKALDEGKRAERNRSTPLGDAALDQPDPTRLPEDRAAANLDSARVREIVGELSPRRQAIVKLRFFFDRTPQEIQRLLGVSERAYRRDLERAVRHIAQRYELVEEGRYCESRRSLVLAYVTGVAGPNRAREARAHLANCPGCAHWAAELRKAARAAAAVAPLPALTDGGALARAAEIATGVKANLADLAIGAKQQAIALGARVDPTSAGAAATARPGPAAAAIAGCLVVGGGATYCAVEEVPSPIRSLVAQVAPEQPPAPEADAEPGSEPPPPPQVQTEVADPVTPAPPTPAPAPAPEPAAPAPPPPPPVEQEFGLSGAAEPAAPTTPAPSSSTAPPSAAPVAPPTEFGP